MKPIPQPATCFAGKLQRWRARLDLTQTQAAERLGVPYRTLVNWEQTMRSPAAWQQKMLLRIMREEASR